MTFLPIADRELRVAARRRNTFWTRLASAGIGVVIGIWALLMAYVPGFGSQPGQLIFNAVSSLSFVFCLLGGMFKTADALSEEKREGTLGLLFLTDLRGYDVVLGKIVATSLLWFYGLLAVFPILAMSMLLGGVAPGVFWRTMLAQVNLLFVSLAAGLVISAISRNERRAMAGAALFLFLLFNGPGWLGEWHKEWTGAREVAPAFLVINPGHANTLADDGYYIRRPSQYWMALLCSHLFGWSLLGLASALVVRAWQDRATTARAARWEAWRHRWQLGAPAVRAAFRRHWLSINPFLWLATRERWKTLVAYGAILLLLGYIGLEWIFSNRVQRGFLGEYAVIGALFGALFKVWVALEACRRFVEDRRSGALELILCTPLSVDEIIRGQSRALRRQFTGPTVLLLALSGAYLWARLAHTSPRTSEDFWEMVLPHVGWGLVFVADVLALGRLGMWFGLTSRHTYAAAGKAVLWIQVAPWVMFYLGMSVMMGLLFSRMNLGNTTWTPFFAKPWFFIAFWCALSLAFALFFYLWASRKLRREFRARVVAAPAPRLRFRKRAPLPPPLPGPPALP